MTIREAISDDAECLSSLAIRSKAHWGYSTDFMDACVDELSVSRAYIDNSDFHYVVAVVDEEVVGFYALEGLSGDKIELGALFVDPNYIGTGIGRTLIEKAKSHAVDLGAKKLSIQGDPMPKNFIGQREAYRLAAKNPKVFLVDSFQHFKFHFQTKMSHNKRMHSDAAEPRR